MPYAMLCSRNWRRRNTELFEGYNKEKVCLLYFIRWTREVAYRYYFMLCWIYCMSEICNNKKQRIRHINISIHPFFTLKVNSVDNTHLMKRISVRSPLEHHIYSSPVFNVICVTKAKHLLVHSRDCVSAYYKKREEIQQRV